MTGSSDPGLRVRIVPAKGTTQSGLPFRNPHPEHIGKLGHIIFWDQGKSPFIVLDDGTQLWGFECWWDEVIEEQEVS